MTDNGFTPIPNCLLDRMAEMKPAEFKALMAIYRLVMGYKEYREKRRRHISITKLQDFAGLSRQGVINAMSALEDYGYVTKVDTDGVNEWLVNSVDQESAESSQDSVPVVNSVDGTSQDSLPPSNKRKVSKKTTTAAAREAEKQTDSAFVFYENNIGGMTPRIAEWIQDAISEYGESVVIDAMDEAVKSNVRRWKYIQAILGNWKLNGRKAPTLNGHHSNGNGAAAHGDVWDKVLSHARRGDPNFTDPTLRAAVVAYGWPKLQAIPEGKENFYKQDFMSIYDDKSAATTP